jgi:hypothetical protein|tara:strand:+ start:2817 stop:2987 length:171 start_codon:yes stop_codon:yes gene_type:complete
MAELNDSAGSPFANVFYVHQDSAQLDIFQSKTADNHPILDAWVGEYRDGVKKGESW